MGGCHDDRPHDFPCMLVKRETQINFNHHSMKYSFTGDRHRTIFNKYAIRSPDGIFIEYGFEYEYGPIIWYLLNNNFS